MAFIDEQIAKIRDRSTRLVYPEGAEPNIIRAAARMVDLGIASPILIGDPAGIRKAAEDARASLDGIELVSPADSPEKDRYAEIFAQVSELPVAVAEMMLKKPLYFGSVMVRAGDADCLVGGISTETDEVVAANKLIIGMADGVETPSCISVVEIPGYEGPQGNLLVFSDTGINIDPTAEELADIAITSAHSVREILGWEPRVAMLSFSTCGSANHPRSKKIAEAVAIAKSRAPELLVDGEMQLDTAIVPDVAQRKFTRPSQVAGRANVLIFPNLDAGNIGVKLLQRLAKAQANGGMLQGFAKPVSDLSRGGTAESVVRNSVMAVRAAQSMRPRQ